MKKLLLALVTKALVLTFAGQGSAQAARDAMMIVGSSTVYPFATVVAEQFGKSGRFKTPRVESTGTGGGIKLFCGGVGAEFPDIADASRRMKASELKTCMENGVKEVVEVKIGFDGIVLAQSKKGKPFGLTRREIYTALAKQVPDPKCEECGTLIANPYHTWNAIRSDLPNEKIEVLGPPPTSGTRDAFAELVMEGGCQTVEWLANWKKRDEGAFKRMCQTLREDGAYVEAGENDNLIVQKLVANPKAVGIFGYSFLEENPDRIAAIPVEGVTPDYESISRMDYVVSRPLFFYVKKAHIGMIPGIQEYLAEFTSEKAWGNEGYLTKKGFIPLPVQERRAIATTAKLLKPLSL